MVQPFEILSNPRDWKPGDTQEIPESALKNLRREGRFDSSPQIYELDGSRWKARDKVSQPTGETLLTLVCVNE